MKVFIFKALIFTIILHVYQSLHEQEEVEKKTKVLACFALSRGRMEQDSTFKKAMGESEGQEIFHKNLMNSLVNCYTKISLDHITSILSSLQGGSTFDPTSKEYKDLLNHKKIEKTLSQEELNIAIKEINELMNQLRKEQQGGGVSNDDEERPSKGLKGFSIYNIIQLIIGLNSSILKMLALDGYLGILVIIILSFFLLRTLSMISSKKKKVSKIVSPKQE